ncbi:porin family protein, partial [Bacteroides heparinolyticus]|uniref:porin family protein n=1 Tax=Prevotella heparinolytica TaxID=28113 RepID=UPI0035A09041
MKIYFKGMVAMALGMWSVVAVAQQDRNQSIRESEKKGWEYEVKAGVNIGGASPIPLPEEIRKVNSFSPKFNGVVEGTVTKWLGREKNWGVSTGLRIEEKGMKTVARVKNYSTEILNDGNKVAGRWTGRVETDYNSTFLTLPVMANYRFNGSWKVRAGMYVSYR